jgi:two-component system, LytTR family, sensor kinase
MAVNENMNSDSNGFPIWEIIYWIIAALLMFFIFSNRHYDIHIRSYISLLFLAISFVNAMVINNYLIPKLLFKGKRWLFFYLLFALLTLSLWLISVAISIIVLYTYIALPSMNIPSLEDIIILLTGTYLISLLSSVFYFTKESYQSKAEKSNIEKQKNILELKLKEVQLQLLKEQIHPHFIFNMMNNLYALVNVNAALSRDLILRLSDLLDYMLYECSADWVELSNEIRFINNYIELEKIRHDEDFNVITDFPNNISGVKIAPLILFPLVENAFKHGLKQTNKDFISMKLKMTSSQIQFNIKNSIHDSAPYEVSLKRSKGLGLRNIRERLEFVYSSKHDLQISTSNSIYEAQLNVIR